ncbi:MAG TPA: hypothetical protein VE326_03440 [Candidatus Binatia bacterium]|nr:hypothetical protein [Candidatus Binatia bacterium]
MKHPHRRSLLLLAVVALSASALWITGCSKDGAPVLAPKLSQSGSSGSFSGVIRLDDPGIRAAIASQERATPGLMGNGIIGTGVSADAAGKAVIVVYTEREGVRVPAEIDGIKTRTLVTGHVIPYARPGGGSLQMGNSTGNDNECASGTLGAVVVKGGVDYFLSNNHVFARENAASIGERIDAPGRYDGKPKCAQTPQIGTLAAFQRITFGGSNTVDCAIAQPSSGLSYSAVSAGGYTPSQTTVSPSVGLAVKKTGRTSGLTHDTIQAVNVTITVGYTDGNATFTGQIQTGGQFIRSGDSGSLMVTETGNNPVGLCFAGSSSASFSNPIGPVLQALGVSMK